MERYQIAIDKKAWNGFVDSLSAKKYGIHLLIAVLSKVNPKDSDPKQLRNISLDLRQLKNKMGVVDNNAITYLKNAVKAVMSTPIEFEDDRYITWRHFLEAPKIDKQNWLITVNIHSDFLPFITDLKQFLEIKERILGATQRSILFYTTLKSIHAKNVYKITPEELQVGCKVAYPTYGHFKQKFMVPVIENLAENGVDIKFKEHKTGCKVTSLSFTISETVEIPEIEAMGIEIPEPVVKQSKKKKDKYADQIQEIFDYYVNVCNKDSRYKATKERLAPIRDRLEEGFTVEECKLHIDFIEKSPYHNGKNDSGTIYKDIAKIIFHRSKFHERIDNISKKKPKKVKTDAEIEAEYNARMAELMKQEAV